MKAKMYVKLIERMKSEYAIPFKIDDKVQGVIFITESQYRKLKRLEDGSTFKLHLKGMKGNVDQKEVIEE